MLRPILFLALMVSGLFSTSCSIGDGGLDSQLLGTWTRKYGTPFFAYEKMVFMDSGACSAYIYTNSTNSTLFFYRADQGARIIRLYGDTNSYPWYSLSNYQVFSTSMYFDTAGTRYYFVRN